jgi:hypothetical protein
VHYSDTITYGAIMRYSTQKSLIFLITLASCLYSYSVDIYLSAISSFLDNYTRPITILEVGLTSADYALELASKYKGTYALLLMKDSQQIVDRVREKSYHNVMVLNPKKISAHSFFMLSRCEHIDVVLVHKDIYSALSKNEWQPALDALLTVGDYTFIEITPKHAFLCKKYMDNKLTYVKQRQEDTLLLYTYQKKGLDIPRWTARTIPVSPTPRYTITSNFNQKLLHKDTVDQPIKWIPGLNLKTFVMLRGIYPTDTIIAHQLRNMTHSLPYHNDLTIGNIIIQGETLVPIDFNDKRRNANMYKWLRRALRLFNGDNSRLKNPAKRVEQYAKT